MKSPIYEFTQLIIFLHLYPDTASTTKNIKINKKKIILICVQAFEQGELFATSIWEIIN